MLSLGSYLLGATEIALVGLSLGFSAYRLRGRLMPAWDGAPARLVEAIVAVVLLTWISELLGTLDLLYAGTLVGVSALVALATAFLPGGGGGAGVPRGAEVAEQPSTVGDAAPTGPAGLDALDLDGLKQVWPAVLDQLATTAPALAAFFEEARPVGFEGDVVEVSFPASATFNKRKAETPENREKVAEALLTVTGQGLKPVYVLLDGESEAPIEAPAPAAKDEGLSEEELLERLKSEFDAEEVS